MSTDGRKDGLTDEPITIVPFDLRRGTNRKGCEVICGAPTTLKGYGID